jgi:hypothetical protein
MLGLMSVLIGVTVGLAANEVRKSSAGQPDRWDQLVSQGRHLWHESPELQTPVACATCHHDPESVRVWALAFPRFRPLPPPHGRVMTLLQANAEAVERHYPETDLPTTAVALTAYLTAEAAGRPVSPGVGPGEPVLPERLTGLAASVNRGGATFATRCAGCHDADRVALSVVAWSGLVRTGAGPPELFLQRHRPGAFPLAWNGRDMADLLAYLTSRQAGRVLDLSPIRTAERRGGEYAARPLGFSGATSMPAPVLGTDWGHGR